MKMTKIFKIPFTPKLSSTSIDVHDEIYQLLKHRNPNAELFMEEPELMELYLASILIRERVLCFEELEAGPKNEIQVEINASYGGP